MTMAYSAGEWLISHPLLLLRPLRSFAAIPTAVFRITADDADCADDAEKERLGSGSESTKQSSLGFSPKSAGVWAKAQATLLVPETTGIRSAEGRERGRRKKVEEKSCTARRAGSESLCSEVGIHTMNISIVSEQAFRAIPPVAFADSFCRSGNGSRFAPSFQSSTWKCPDGEVSPRRCGAGNESDKGFPACADPGTAWKGRVTLGRNPPHPPLSAGMCSHIS